MSVVRFSLRSSACVRLPASRDELRLLVEAVPASGSGVALRRFIHRAVGVVPLPLLGMLPRMKTGPEPEELRFIDELMPRLGVWGIHPVRAILHAPPPDDTTGRFAALLIDERAQPIAHLRATHQNLRYAAMTTDAGRRSGVRWPRSLGRFTHGGMNVELTSVLPTGLHRPTRLSVPELLQLVADVDEALGSTCEAPQMHGDLTPWNLRTYPDGSRALFDWEFAGPGPLHADLVRYLVSTKSSLDRFRELPPSTRKEMGPAIDYWWGIINARAATRGTDRWVVQNRERALSDLRDYEEESKRA